MAKGIGKMAFNADEYIGVIVEQIGGNFQNLHHAVTVVPQLEKEKDELIAVKKEPNSALKEREQEIKVSLYEQSIGDLVCNYDAYRSIEPLSVGLFGEWGSGKTYLLKLIENKVIDLQKEKSTTFPQVTIPVFFNAWRFEKEEHLIIPLF